MSNNKNLTKAKAEQDNEWYTKLYDIEQELNHYLPYFEGKTILCNCDDPFESNFYKYFFGQMKHLDIKRLICTSYGTSKVVNKQMTLDGWQSDKAYDRRLAYVIDIKREDFPEDDDNAVFKQENAIAFAKEHAKLLKGDGDFRSEECLKYLDEADIVVTNPPFSCHSKDTEVLTDKGWKLFKDVDAKDDLILSMNIDTKQMEYTHITDVIIQHYSGPMYHFESKYMDQFVTPNHRMIINRKGKNFFKEAKDILDSHDRIDNVGYQYLNDTDMEYYVLPACIQKEQYSRKEIEIPEKHIPMNDWLEFFGFWLADGCTRQGNNSQGNPRYIISIKQRRNNADYVKDLFERIGFDNYKQYMYKTENDNFDMYSKQLWIELNRYGKSRDKYIPRELMNLPKERLQYLLKGYMNGDGEYKDDKQWKMQTVSSQLMDDLIEIYLKVNGRILRKRTVHTKYKDEDYILYQTSFNNINTDGTRYHKRMEEYDGNVYCFTLKKNHTMLVRRNGKESWSGNCFRDYIATLMDHKKKFIVMGNKNAVTYKEIFPYIKENELWWGLNSPKEFIRPDGTDSKQINGLVRWYTNIENKSRNEAICLVNSYEEFKEMYPKYDNYDAIDVSEVKMIPKDYDGVMGVPITFLDHYCPEQFEIIGGTANGQVPSEYKIGNYKTYNNPFIKDTKKFQRILIKRR